MHKSIEKNLNSKKIKIAKGLEKIDFQYYYHLNEVKNLKKDFNCHAVSLKDIFQIDQEDFLSVLCFNYCIDLEWLMAQIPMLNRCKPIYIVHGYKGDDKLFMDNVAKHYQNIKLLQARLNIPFGTHHTKMIIISYKQGIRLIIMTANLIQEDWDFKTQGIWISPLFIPGKTDSTFKKDLLDYIKVYNLTKLKEWIDLIADHDITLPYIHLVGSIPGRHTDKKNNWGHLKLKKILKEYIIDGVEEEDLLIAQFSSIGSLGSNQENWLCSEFLESLSSFNHDDGSNIKCSSMHQLKLIYPSLENVRSSFEGYVAGASLPYSSQTHKKQRYILNFMHQWKSDSLGRSRASPHIKTYARVSRDGKKLRWFLLTSANLSKAAWGTFEKQRSQLAIRSYELGILFAPPNSEPFNLPIIVTTKNEPCLLQIPKPLYLPYDFPLTKYAAGKDEPWQVDIEHGKNDKDCLGNTWPP